MNFSFQKMPRRVWKGNAGRSPGRRVHRISTGPQVNGKPSRETGKALGEAFPGGGLVVTTAHGSPWPNEPLTLEKFKWAQLGASCTLQTSNKSSNRKPLQRPGRGHSVRCLRAYLCSSLSLVDASPPGGQWRGAGQTPLWVNTERDSRSSAPVPSCKWANVRPHKMDEFYRIEHRTAQL